MNDDLPDSRQDTSEEELYELVAEGIRFAIDHGLDEGHARLLCYQTGVKYEHVIHN
jgi:hypothetical protein